jgi:hypothetical protein
MALSVDQAREEMNKGAQKLQVLLANMLQELDRMKELAHRANSQDLMNKVSECTNRIIQSLEDDKPLKLAGGRKKK